MNKPILLALIAVALAAAVFGALRWRHSRQEALCLQGAGPEALQACAALAETSAPEMKVKFLFELAKRHEKAGLMPEALADLKNIVPLLQSAAIDPGWSTQLFETISANSWKQGDQAEAYKYAGLAVAGGSRNALICILAALELGGKGDARGALDLLLKAGGPGTADKVLYYSTLAALHYELKDYDNARLALEAELQAATKPSDIAEVNLKLMMNGLLRNSYGETEARLDKAIAALPGCDKLFLDAELTLAEDMRDMKDAKARRQLGKLLLKLHAVTRNCAKP